MNNKTTEDVARNILDMDFDVKHIENTEWMPSDTDRQDMEEGDFKDFVAMHNKAEELVIFENMSVEWDSCDCGGGYGCSHGRYPTDIFLMHEGGRVKIVEFQEEDTIEIMYNDRYVQIRDCRKLTMREFIYALKAAGVPYRLKKEFDPDQQTAGLQSPEQYDAKDDFPNI